MIGSSFKERAFQASQSPFHLAPNSADRVLPHGAAEQSRERPAHPARVWSRQDRRRRSARRLFRAPLVGRNGRVLPLDRLAVRCFQAGSRDTDRHRPKGSHQLALTMAVPVASPYNRPAAYAGLGQARPFISGPRPSAALSSASRSSSMKPRMRVRTPGFQGIEPIVPKKSVPSAASSVAFVVSVFMA